MATSYVHPVARFQADRLKFRQKFTIAARGPVEAPRVAASADRRAGVGPSTSQAPTEAARPSRALVADAVDTALDCIGILERQTRDVARRFRRDATVGEANLGLTSLVESLQTLLRLAEAASAAEGTPLDVVCERCGLNAPRDTQRAVSELIRAQMRQNWTLVASVLEQRFVAVLASWRRVFEGLGGFPPDPYETAA